MLPRILILVLAGGDNKYLKMEESFRNTCGKDKPEGLDIFFIKGSTSYFQRKLYGLIRRLKVEFNIDLLTPSIVRYLASKYSNSQVYIDNDSFYTDVPDTWYLLSIKTIKAFSYFINHHEFDYIFRTNLGSYIHLRRLQEYFYKLPRQELYIARKGYYLQENKYKGLVYGSGAGFGISRDLVVKLVMDMDSIIAEQLQNYGILIDDMQFGNKIINTYRVPLVEGKTQDVKRNTLESGYYNPGEDDHHYYFSGYKDYRSHLLLHELIK